ncbi:uncharacterized protein [Ptychodera flava]|uniref:uncharacterized protein n=1 Tax=Ptychodera flava TaxID=63121 RepID=UPI00396A9C23
MSFYITITGRRQVLFLALALFASFVMGYMLAQLEGRDNHVAMLSQGNINTRVCLEKWRKAEIHKRFEKEANVKQPLKKVTGPRKILLDCGANVASTVNLFRETYPDAKDYIIHSFEIDAGLAPYFAYYQDKGHTLHCPVGVADKDGNMTAFNEGVWFPGKVNMGLDMQWGGGSLFVSGKEGVDKQDGGKRKLSRHDVIPTVDLSQWIQRNVNKEDYVIFKLDVEGAEYGILRKMLKDGTFEWIDKFYGEYHPTQPTGETEKEKKRITDAVAKEITDIISWSAETKEFQDFDKVNSPTILTDTPGSKGQTLDSCGVVDKMTTVSIVIEVGMNAKRARKLIATIAAYPIDVHLTLFIYGDFAEEHPDLVKEWSTKYEIGIRCDGPMSSGNWELQYSNAIRLSIVSAERRLSDIGLQAHYILPPGVNKVVSDVVTKRKLRLIQPRTTFPPKGKQLTSRNYHKFRDVEKVPKALRMINDGLAKSGGILSLDSDFPDNNMISVFLLDYLYQTSGHEVVKLECAPGTHVRPFTLLIFCLYGLILAIVE